MLTKNMSYRLLAAVTIANTQNKVGSESQPIEKSATEISKNSSKTLKALIAEDKHSPKSYFYSNSKNPNRVILII